MIQYSKDMPVDVAHEVYEGKGDTLMATMLGTLPPHNTFLKRITLGPGCSVGEHIHEGDAELYLPISGTFVLTYDGKEYEISAGDAHCCFSGHKHAIENRGTAPADFIAVIIAEEP